MKSIERGTDEWHKIIQFDCKCGCKFDTNKKDYFDESKKNYVSECPVCGADVLSDRGIVCRN